MVHQMKILIISDAWHPQTNGVVKTYENLSHELTDMGHDVAIIGPEDFQQKISLPGYSEIKLVVFPNRRLAKSIRAHHADHIHIAVEGPLGRAARAFCHRHNIPFSTCYHTQFAAYIGQRVPRALSFTKNLVERISWMYVRRFHRHSFCVFVAGKKLEQTLRDNGFSPPFAPLTRGVDPSIFYPDQTTDIFPDLPRPIALYVGRISVEKNIEEFLSMPWTGSKVIVGHGPLKKSLEKKYPNVHFAGKQSGKDLADHYRSADLFVFPSLTDTFGIVLIEALACGIPVAAHSVIGPIDIVTDPYLGALDNDLSKAAETALAHNDEKYTQKRFDYIKQHYSWRKAAEQFLSVTHSK